MRIPAEIRSANVFSVRVITVVLFISFVTNLHAWIVAPFPGLSLLLAQSDAVVLLRIEKVIEPLEASAAGYGLYECLIYQVLKGDIHPMERINLQLMNTGGEWGFGNDCYSVWSSHLVCLMKRSDATERTEYRTLQIKGSNMRLSPYGNEKLPKGESIEVKIKTLLRRSVEYWDSQRKKDAELLEEMLK